MAESEHGAVDVNACVTRWRWGCCQCGKCKVCGYPKHTAIHGPLFGEPPGSKPYGHEFQPHTETETADADRP